MQLVTQIDQLVETESLGAYSHNAIRKHFKKATKYRAKVLKDVDPEPLHQMRVGLRRLRTAVDVFADALDLPKAASEKQIQAIAHCLGDLRDLDVLHETLARHNLPTLAKAEQRALRFVLKKLENRRKKRFRQVEKLLNGSKYEQFKQSVQAWLEQPNYGAIALFSIQQALPDLLLPLLSRLLLHPGWLVGLDSSLAETNNAAASSDLINQWLDTHGIPLHDLRKQIKRTRYQAEFFTEFYGDDYQAWVNELQQAQELLGQLQDCWVLSEFLATELGEQWKQSCPMLAQHLHQERADAWRMWQPMQQRYLSQTERDRLRQIIVHPIFEPVTQIQNRKSKIAN
jgi:CHAD domain-containing protein